MKNKYELALEEIKNNFKLQCEGVDACKFSARSSINASALIIALISLLENKKGSLLSLGACSAVFWAWLITIFFFISMVIIYVLAIRPIEMTAPIKSTKEKFKEVFYKNSDEKSIKILIKKYQQTIANNRPIVHKVSNLAKWTNYFGAISLFMAFIVYFLCSFCL